MKNKKIDIDLKDGEMIVHQLQAFLDEHLIPNSRDHHDIKMGLIIKNLIERLKVRINSAKDDGLKNWWRR